MPIKSSAKVEDDDDEEEVEDEYDEMIDTHFTDDDFKIEPSEQTNGRKVLFPKYFIQFFNIDCPAPPRYFLYLVF